MYLTSPGPLLTPPPSSSPPKTPIPVLLRPNSIPQWEPDPAPTRRPRRPQAGTGHRQVRTLGCPTSRTSREDDMTFKVSKSSLQEPKLGIIYYRGQRCAKGDTQCNGNVVGFVVWVRAPGLVHISGLSRALGSPASPCNEREGRGERREGEGRGSSLTIDKVVFMITL
jgi:hypothetical protein